MSRAVATREDIFRQAGQRPASEASGVEHTRAIAEVMGALKVAQAFPRDETAAFNRVIAACQQRAVAERAFFKFPRGGGTVEGESIHLAVELARCWGNIEHKIMELDRDDFRGVSEMLAVAWDLQTNTRAVMGFLVPHKRDKRGGAEALTDLRDIYENNANNGARRVRECIFRVLPKWLVEAAVEQCRKTLATNHDGKPFAQRVSEALAAFDAAGIKQDRIEAKLGPVAKFTETDLAGLRVSYRSINNREVSADEEFPPIDEKPGEKVAQQIRAQTPKSQPAPGIAQPAESLPDGPTTGDPGAPEVAQSLIRQWVDRVSRADSKEQVELIGGEFDLESSVFSPAEQGDFEVAYLARIEALKESR